MNITTATATSAANELIAMFGSRSLALAALNEFATEFQGYAIREILSRHMGGTNDQAVDAVRIQIIG